MDTVQRSALVVVGVLLLSWTAEAKLLLHAPLDGNVQCVAGEGEASLVEGASFVPGSRGQAIVGPENAAGAAELPLAGNCVAERGTLMFWFQPQRPFFREPLDVSLLRPKDGKGLRMTLSVREPHVNFVAQLVGAEGRAVARAQYNNFKRDRWYHVAFTWDVAQSDVCLWLFGFPQADLGPYGLPEGFKPGEWGGTLLVGDSEVAIDDLRIYDEAMEGEQIRQAAGLGAMDILADEAKVVYNTTIDLDALRGELLCEDGFDADWQKNWVLEGPGNVRHENGELYMESKEPPGGHIVLWNKQDFPASFVAEWDFTPTKETGLCIVFFCAKGRNGEDLFDPKLAKRDGVFKTYHSGDLNCYHISYFRNTCKRAPICAQRKNFGFYRIMSGPDYIPIEAGRKNHCALIKRGAHIQFVTNGKVSLDWVDDGKTYGPVWGEGKIGLRQMGHTYGRYDNFRVYAAKDGINGIELR